MSEAKISHQLDAIQAQLAYIKEHMVDKDMLLDEEDKKLLQESYENEKRGELISQEDLAKQLGI